MRARWSCSSTSQAVACLHGPNIKGAATITAALLSLQLPNVEVRLQARELLLSVATSQNDLATTLAALEDAIQPERLWSSEALETARRHALTTLKRQLSQEQVRFQHELSRVVHRRLGYPTPGLEQLQKMIIHMTPGRARAWFERYVSDTNKTLILTGHVKGIQPKALVKRVLVRSASIGVDTPTEKQQSPVGAKQRRQRFWRLEYRDTPRCIHWRSPID